MFQRELASGPLIGVDHVARATPSMRLRAPARAKRHPAGVDEMAGNSNEEEGGEQEGEGEDRDKGEECDSLAPGTGITEAAACREQETKRSSAPHSDQTNRFVTDSARRGRSDVVGQRIGNSIAPCRGCNAEEV